LTPARPRDAGRRPGSPDQLALIDHELRFLPGLLHARELIAAGAIGAVRFALGLLLGSGRADPNRPWQWRSDRSRGGGLVSAMGSHQVDTLRHLLGAGVTSAAGSLATLIPVRPGPDGPRAVTADDTFSAALELTGGTHATLAGSAVLPVAEPESLTLYGEEGALRWTGGRLLRASRGGPFEDISPPHRHDLLPGLQGNFAHGTIYRAPRRARRRARGARAGRDVRRRAARPGSARRPAPVAGRRPRAKRTPGARMCAPDSGRRPPEPRTDAWLPPGRTSRRLRPPPRRSRLGARTASSSCTCRSPAYRWLSSTRRTAA
jgi:predicted dehydrogenase